jgi:hypothetical protein
MGGGPRLEVKAKTVARDSPRQVKTRGNPLLVKFVALEPTAVVDENWDRSIDTGKAVVTEAKVGSAKS